jgi:hypothetical protein
MNATFKLKLIDDWREGWKYLSVQCFALAAAVNGTWYSIPDGLKSSIPANYVTIGSVILAGVGILGRFLEFDGSANAIPAISEAGGLDGRDHKHDDDGNQWRGRDQVGDQTDAAQAQIVNVQVNNVTAPTVVTPVAPVDATPPATS